MRGLRKMKRKRGFMKWGLAGVLILLLCGFSRPVTAKAEEAEFLSWYEDNKNKDGATYALTDTLYLTAGTEENPVRLGGTGKVEIDCGMHEIIIKGNVLIDNPGLEIKGNSFFVVMVNGNDAGLALQQGCIRLDSEWGTGIQVNLGGLRGPGEGDVFTICGKGGDLTGIFLGNTPDTSLANMQIDMSGSGTVFGIRSNFKRNLNVSNSSIHVTGNTEAYGIGLLGGGDISADHVDIRSRGSGNIYSIYTDGGRISLTDAALEPEVTEEGDVYRLLEQKSYGPVYISEGQPAAEWGLPGTIEVYADGSRGEEVVDVPVAWHTGGLSSPKTGYYEIEGAFSDTGGSGCRFLNPHKVVPAYSVICLPEEKMCLLGCETVGSAGDSRIMRLLFPYPYGADDMELLYSRDGTEFQAYSWGTGTDALTESEEVRGGLGVLVLRLPSEQERWHIKMAVQGDSLFRGTSRVWVVDPEKGFWPEADDGSSGGDRGGQKLDITGDDTVQEGQEDMPAYGKEAGGQNTAKEGLGQKDKPLFQKQDAATQADGDAIKHEDTEKEEDAQEGTGAVAPESLSSRPWVRISAAIAALVIAAGGLAWGIRCFRKK